MTSCLPVRRLAINGSLTRLSSLAMLKRNSRFVRNKSDDSNYYSDAVQMLGENEQVFRISGEIKLSKRGRIKWGQSSLHEISFTDASNAANDFQITNLWEFDFKLKTLIKSSPKNYTKFLLNKGFTLQGGEGKDVINLASMPAPRKYIRPQISGGAGADLIIGSDKDDYLAASTSRDICDFGIGTNLASNIDDVLTGNAGKDTFYADNGTRVTDIELGEVIHLFSHISYDLNEINNKTPSFKHKSNRTIIRVGDLKIITNPARFDFAYKFYAPEYKMCRTDESGTICSMGQIPGEPEGYSFTAIEIM